MTLPKRFHVLEELSRSEAEIVLRARDELLEREVVISRPIPNLGGTADPKDLERSLRQARALARVHHPGVVRLLDVQETVDGPLLVMEPVSGETLAEVLARERHLSPERVRALALKLCDALEAVHAAGVVHRGISTGNIVVRADGNPCLTGFVFAKFGPGGESLPGTTFEYRASSKSGSKTGVAPAIPPHPAPEQILGQTADARSDVFGLGWVLYTCLTGESPYPFDHDCEHWHAPADPRRSAPGTPRVLAETLLKCLSSSPLKRIGSAREVREALNAGFPEMAADESTRPTAPRRRRIAAVAVGLLILIGIGVQVALHLAQPRDRNRGDAGADESRGISAKGIDPPRAGAAAMFSDKYDRSHALLIGIGEVYAKNGFPALPNAERDVTTLAARLNAIQSGNERWNVEVLEGQEATRDNILTRLHAITDEAKENDKVFVYYAGHGGRHEVSGNSGWIIPADGLTQETDASRKTWVRFDEFGHLFEESKSKHVLVAMDCCYGGRLITARSVPSAASAYSRRLLTEPAKIILTSGRPNEQVSDGVRGENSPFARAFLDALSRTDVEAVTTTDIFAGIQRKFLEEEVAHLPVRGNPPGAPQAGEVVFFLK